jgi:hypothetical protein
MPADQAAGLRRRRAQRPVRCLHVFSESPHATLRLAQALHRLGCSALLVDKTGRLFGDAPTRSLFDWRQQLARADLHTLPLPYGDGWHAPGARVDDPAWANVAHAHAHVVFDEGAVGAELALMPDAASAVLIEVGAAQESMQRAYALLKTLHRLDGVSGIALAGGAADCERVRSACAQFLDPHFAQGLFCPAQEDDAFAALAVRMTDEETGLTTRE